jgi:hypothetical protein
MFGPEAADLFGGFFVYGFVENHNSQVRCFEKYCKWVW